MSTPALSQQDLESYRNDAGIIREVAEQVIRDFSFFSISIHFSGNAATAYEELYEQVCPCIAELGETSYSRLQDVLYRIDLPEAAVAEAFAQTSITGVYERLTMLVLQRELVKVITRKIYSAS